MKKAKKFNRILWSGKHVNSGCIAYQNIFSTKREAVQCFKGFPGYKVVKVNLKEIKCY